MGVSNVEIYEYRQMKKNFSMDQGELSSEWKTVGIRLSSARQIVMIENSLRQSLKDSEIEERGNDITVSGYPPDNADFEDTVLTIVRKYDSGAVIIQ